MFDERGIVNVMPEIEWQSMALTARGIHNAG